MDKTRDVRRVFSRFSGQSNQAVHEKLKRGKVRRLSVVGKESAGEEQETEMGSVAPDGEDELFPRNGINKKFKLPKKLFDNRNPVDHASVPRKLRSAMKKRSCKPIPSPLPNPKTLINSVNGVESLKYHCLKKSKLNMQNGASDCSPNQAISGLITKDEEEVAETLYALAALIPGNSCLMRNKLDGESSVEKPLDSSNKQMNSMPVPEVPKEESQVTCPPTSSEVTNLAPATEASSEENVKVELQTGPVFLSQDKLTGSREFNLNINSSAPQVNLQTIFPLSNIESPQQNSVCFGVPAELSIDSVHVKNHEAILAQRKSDNVVGVTSQDERQDAALDHGENGPTLWPGLFSKGSHASGVDGHSLCSDFPSWLSTADYLSRPGLYEPGTSTENVSRPVNTKGKSWKRCAAHVYIGRLIQVLQISGEKDMQPSEACQISSFEGIVTASNHQNAAGNSLNGIVSARAGVDSASEKNLNEALNGVLMYRRLHQDQKLVSPAPEVHAPRKQSFDFLSLSTGSGGPHAKNDANSSRNVLDPLSPIYVSSFPRHSAAPFPMPQNRHTAISYQDQISAAAVGATPPPQVHLQLPPYFGSYARPLHMSSTTSTPHPPQLQTQQQQQQQQQIWTAQLAAHCRSGTRSTSHVPVWQNSRQDSQSSMQYIQTLPTLQSSLQAIRSKHLQIPQQQQQQQLIALASSLPPSQTKTPHNQLSSSYEENGGRFCQEGILPLQLLCNERF